MARDRLPELIQRTSSCNSTYTNGPTTQQPKQVEAIAMEQNRSVDVILNPYSEIRTYLAQLAANLESMSRMTQPTSTRNDNEMEEMRKQNIRLGNLLMAKFQEFKANLPPEDDFSLEARMKRTLFYGLHQNYIDIWRRNEQFLYNYEAKLKQHLKMQSKIINCNATEEEIEELIGNKTTSLFVGNIIEETEKERKTLRDLIDRYGELRKLEKSIEEVNALFLRIQCLVLEQSDVIQRVEFHAQQATLHVDKGAGEIEKADRLQKKALKKKVLIILIVIGLLLLLVIVGVFL